MSSATPAAVEIEHIRTRFGNHVIHDDISLSIGCGEIVALLGGSGSGKTTLMRVMALLLQPQSGKVRLFGDEVAFGTGDEFNLRRRMGYMFQFGALFGGLSIRHNVALPLMEHTALNNSLINEIAQLKVQLVGLAPDVAGLMPSELSGGMVKRAAMARALALDPELLMLDEPGSGLDPASARSIDELILQLRSALGLTVIMVTHDLTSVQRIADRAILLHKGKILADAAPRELLESDDQTVRYFFQLEVRKSQMPREQEVEL